MQTAYTHLCQPRVTIHFVSLFTQDHHPWLAKMVNRETQWIITLGQQRCDLHMYCVKSSEVNIQNICFLCSSTISIKSLLPHLSFDGLLLCKYQYCTCPYIFLVNFYTYLTLNLVFKDITLCCLKINCTQNSKSNKRGIFEGMNILVILQYVFTLICIQLQIHVHADI